jgi:phosphoribosylformylglycinamidine (FGAM) synthase-like amidotransferase family enzyme
LNLERHRNYIALHRNDISFSSMYASMENVFVSIAKGEGNGNMKESLFKMTKAEQVVLESFLQARNNALLFGKCNFDKNGKCTVFEPDSGRPIPMGRFYVAHFSLKAVA